MKRGRSTGNQTREEAAWITDVKRSGCVCCSIADFPWDEDGPLVEAHHLLSGGIRRGHLHTIGLCAWHHRGRVVVEAWSLRMHRTILGPSLAEGSVPFHEKFGSDEELMQHQVVLIEYRRRAAA